MNETPILPAPEIPSAPISDSKWERERREFMRLKPSLMATHQNQYVAIHEGQVVESGEDQIEVALRAYRRHGYVPIYVGHVSNDPPRVARIPSPRRV